MPPSAEASSIGPEALARRAIDERRYEDLVDFVDCYQPKDRSKRVETDRFHRFTYDELVAPDRANFDIIWLRDESLEDGPTLPPAAVIAAEIVEELTAALAQFAELAASLPPT